MPPLTVLLTGLATALAASALHPWLSRVAGTESFWLRREVPAALAGVAGGAAALVAQGWAELAAYSLLAVACGALVAIDLATFRLPDAIVGPTYPLLFAALTAAAASTGEWGRLGRAVAAAGVVGLGYLALHLVVPAGLGLGDVKLSGLLGGFLGWLGWPHALAGTLAAFVLNALCAGMLLVTGRVQRSGDVPFGPWMVLGAAVGAGWGPLAFPALG